mgnify:FL=1|tara:strand:+ start:84 stop:599 length:516 start_codon:yes stop_codon:yes gene_type:complete
MDIKAPFKINFLTIKTEGFFLKRKEINKKLKKFPEKRYANFHSNRQKCTMEKDFVKIFEDEFLKISKYFQSQMNLESCWSATYSKGDYHVPHNHGSTGYCGILYLDMHKKSPSTVYMQPWNDDFDNTLLYEPSVEEGDIVIVPKFVVHFTRPNLVSFKKRIISFDFNFFKK